MLKRILIIVLFFALFSSVEINAQGRPPCVPTPTNPCPPPGRPIDGGIAILVALGAAYGVNKLRRKED